jgi:hypothetical protein
MIIFKSRFSGADLSILSRDAQFQPLRALQKCNTYKIVDYLQNGDPVYKPCNANEPDKVEISLMTMKPEQIIIPKITLVNQMIIRNLIRKILKMCYLQYERVFIPTI